MNNYYVYELIDPKTGDVFYVGYGKNDRMFQHIKEAKSSAFNSHKLNKIRQILNSGYIDILYNKPYQNLTKADAKSKEIELIDFHGLQNLTNITKGGDGGDTLSNHPNKKEIGNKISIKLKEKYEDPAFLEKRKKEIIRATETRKQNFYHHSEETKQKISQSHKGKSLSEEHIKIISECLSKRNKIKWNTDIEYSTKMKMIHSNKILSEETKQKISQGHKGKSLSEEHKQKISNTLKGRIPWNKGKHAS